LRLSHSQTVDTRRSQFGLNKLLTIQTLFQDADLPSSFSFLVATEAGIHWRFQMIFLLWLLTGPYLHFLVSHLHYVSIKNKKKKYSTKLLTFGMTRNILYSVLN